MTTSQYKHKSKHLPQAFAISAGVYLSIFVAFLVKDLFADTLKSEALVASTYRQVELKVEHFVDHSDKKAPVLEQETKTLLDDHSQIEVDITPPKQEVEEKPQEKEPKVEPLVEPKKEEPPKPEPKVEPKPEPKPQPKPEPKPKPKPEPKPQPKTVRTPTKPKVETAKAEPPAKQTLEGSSQKNHNLAANVTGSGIAAASANQGTQGADVSLSYGVDSSAVLSQIKRAIDSNLVYERKARMMRKTGVVVVQFRLTTSGSLSFVKVLQSSGHDILDQSAIETIKRARADFPQVSHNYVIRIPIQFVLL